MIARVWRGTTAEKDAVTYTRYVEGTGVAKFSRAAGNRGVLLLRQLQDGEAHFVFISLWNDMDAIRSAVGEDVDRAVYFPEDTRWLRELQPNVEHYTLESAVNVELELKS